MLGHVRLSEQGLKILEELIRNSALPAGKPFDELRTYGLGFIHLQRTIYGRNFFSYGDVAANFDAWTSGAQKYKPHTTYDKEIEPMVHLHASLAEMVLSYLQPDSLILDVGCGTGQLGSHFITANHTGDGLDISPEMMKGAQMK